MSISYWWVDSLEADAGVRLSFYAFSTEVAPLVKLWTEHLCWVPRQRLASTFLSTYAVLASGASMMSPFLFAGEDEMRAGAFHCFTFHVVLHW